MHIVDGIQFKTASQARRYRYLKDREARGEIADVRINVSYALKVNGRMLGRFYVEFAYTEQGKAVVETASAGDSNKYHHNLKRELFAAIYRVEIRES